MLRIHFTAEDLTRTRITTTYGPLAETILGLAQLPRPSTLFSDWQRRTLREGGHWNWPLQQVASLCCPVDLLTVTGEAASLDEGLAALAAARPAHLKAEVDVGLARQTRDRTVAPSWWSWARAVPEDRGARDHLVQALRTSCDATVGPYWHRIRGHLVREVELRSRQLAIGGVGELLAGLHSNLRWKFPVLEVWTDRPEPTDLYLAGRGIELVPSLFCRGTPPPFLRFGDPAASPLLVYPAAVDAAEALRILTPPWTEGPDQAISELLGRSRAAVLRATVGGRSTTEIARRTGLSLASASQHARILRNAKLISTRRVGGSVRHTATPLGQLLLDDDAS